MLSLTMSRMVPPAASTTAPRFRSTCSSCATTSPGATRRPSASLASCPARKSSAPPRTRMPWLKPRGAGRAGGTMICLSILLFSLALRRCPGRGVGVAVDHMPLAALAPIDLGGASLEHECPVCLAHLLDHDGVRKVGGGIHRLLARRRHELGLGTGVPLGCLPPVASEPGPPALYLAARVAVGGVVRARPGGEHRGRVAAQNTVDCLVEALGCPAHVIFVHSSPFSSVTPIRPGWQTRLWTSGRPTSYPGHAQS